MRDCSFYTFHQVEFQVKKTHLIRRKFRRTTIVWVTSQPHFDYMDGKQGSGVSHYMTPSETFV